MTYIREVSDLHLEFYYDLYSMKSLARAQEQLNQIIPPLPSDEQTVLIIAGDLAPICRPQRIVAFLALVVPRFAHTFYVFGNHEHYNGDINTSQQILEDAIAGSSLIDRKKLTIASNNIARYDHGDVTFLGGTLWADYANLDPRSVAASSLYINDHKVIKYKDKAFSPQDGYYIFQRMLAQLEGELIDRPDNSKTVIVTHHMPSYQAIDPRYLFDKISRLINSSFASNLDDFILKYQPDYWFFGHTHMPYRGKIRKTELVCNPLGYPTENNFMRGRYTPDEVFSL